MLDNAYIYMVIFMKETGFLVLQHSFVSYVRVFTGSEVRYALL